MNAPTTADGASTSPAAAANTSTEVVSTASLAHAFGVSADDVAAFIDGASIPSTSASSTYTLDTATLSTGSNAQRATRAGLTGLGITFTAAGVPDFSAIVKAGGKVTGCLPPDGQSSVIWSISGVSTTVQYAVEIDKGDGSAPIYLKGVNVSTDAAATKAQRKDALVCAAKLMAQMPSTLDEVRTRCWAGQSEWITPQRSIDITA